jgi:hypothetical protein
MSIVELDKAIREICPIHGVNSNREIAFMDDATAQQRIDAQSIADSWDFNSETPQQVIARLESALDRHLDTVANSYRYESIRTMVTYATSDHPTFGAEGKAAVKFRDAVYAYGIQVIADVQAEIREIPTETELIAELPPFESFLI